MRLWLDSEKLADCSCWLVFPPGAWLPIALAPLEPLVLAGQDVSCSDWCAEASYSHFNLCLPNIT